MSLVNIMCYLGKCQLARSREVKIRPQWWQESETHLIPSVLAETVSSAAKSAIFNLELLGFVYLTIDLNAQLLVALNCPPGGGGGGGEAWK